MGRLIIAALVYEMNASLLIRMYHWVQRYEFVCIYYHVSAQFLLKLQYFNYFRIICLAIKVDKLYNPIFICTFAQKDIDMNFELITENERL